MSGYTKGPWRVHRHHKPISDEWVFSVVTDEEYGEIIAGTCTAKPQLDEKIRLANANLIAAAPDLLEALEEAVSMIDVDSNVSNNYEMAKRWIAAIARSRGQS